MEIEIRKNVIRKPQFAFEMSIFVYAAVRIMTPTVVSFNDYYFVCKWKMGHLK